MNWVVTKMWCFHFRILKISKLVNRNLELTESKAFLTLVNNIIPGKLFSFVCVNISNADLVHSEINLPGMYAFCSRPSKLSKTGFNLLARIADINL